MFLVPALENPTQELGAQYRKLEVLSEAPTNRVTPFDPTAAERLFPAHLTTFSENLWTICIVLLSFILSHGFFAGGRKMISLNLSN